MPTRCSPTCRACRRSRSRTGRTRSRFPFDHAGGARGLARAVLSPGPHVDDPARVGRMESRRLPGRGPRPLQRLPLGRNVLGATAARSTSHGGLIPIQNWYAPSLASPREASVGRLAEAAKSCALLKTGVSAQGFAHGADERSGRSHSTQYLSDADLAAMATYLQARSPATVSGVRARSPRRRRRPQRPRGAAP